MKVCLHTTHTITQNYIGGTERFLIKIAKELRLFGWSPFIVCSSRIPETEVEGIKVLGKIPKKYRKASLKYKRLGYDFLKNEVINSQDPPYTVILKLSSYVTEQLDGIDADIYHLNSFVSAAMIDNLRNYIITNHENDQEIDYFWGKNFFNNFSQLVKTNSLKIQNANGLFVPSMYYSKMFSNAFNLQVYPIKLGVLLNDFPFDSNRDKNKQLQNPNLSENDRLLILLPSRLNITQKGHDIALKACQILRNQGVNFHLLITGIGKSSESDVFAFRQEIKKYNIENSVTLSSYDNILNAYNMCDVVISPERYCSYGLSISEALALGINTILSDIPTYKEIAKDYAHAHFFESGNHLNLANVLLDLWKKKQTLTKLDVIQFRMNNDIRDCAKLYSEIYYKILNNEH